MDAQFTKVAIVALGTFTPQAYTPHALSEGRVLPENEASRTTLLTLVSGEVVEFKAPWGRVFVAGDRFQVETEEAPYVRICDFMTKVLNDLPSPFQIHAFGINFECHFDLGSFADRDALGKRLAPPAAWGAWGKSILENMHGSATDNPLHGGLVSMTMRQPFVQTDSEPNISGWLDVSIAVSSRFPNSGIYCRTNHHHHIVAPNPKASEDEKMERNRAMLRALADGFDGSVIASEDIIREAVSA